MMNIHKTVCGSGALCKFQKKVEKFSKNIRGENAGMSNDKHSNKLCRRKIIGFLRYVIQRRVNRSLRKLRKQCLMSNIHKIIYLSEKT